MANPEYERVNLHLTISKDKNVDSLHFNPRSMSEESIRSILLVLMESGDKDIVLKKGNRVGYVNASKLRRMRDTDPASDERIKFMDKTLHSMSHSDEIILQTALRRNKKNNNKPTSF